MTLRDRPFENIEGKEENAGNQHFLLFAQCFLPFTNACAEACEKRCVSTCVRKPGNTYVSPTAMI